MNMAVGFENMLTKGKLFEAMKAVTDSAVMSPSSSLLTHSHYFPLPSFFLSLLSFSLNVLIFLQTVRKHLHRHGPEIIKLLENDNSSITFHVEQFKNSVA